MAGGLYGRVAARGFPSSVTDGLTGAGALESQGGPTDPAHGDTSQTGDVSQVLTGYPADTPADPQVLILESVWGLPGELDDPDHTPGAEPGPVWSHAAPVPGWAGSYHDTEAIAVLNENSALIHGQNFGALQRHTETYGVTRLPMDPWQDNNPGESVLEPLTGQIRAMAGNDRVQGYSLSNRYGFDAGHRDRLDVGGNVVNAYLDPAERPFIVPQAQSTFTPTDTVQGPEAFASMLAADNLSADAPTAYNAPPEPETLTGQLPGAPAAAGWW
jgi:hypothetical protein